jgi:hypothetical protein
MATNNKLPKKKVEEEAKNISNANDSASELEKKIFDLPSFKKDGGRESINGKNPYVVLKYFQSDFECFSDWDKDELKQFSKFLEHFGKNTWESVYRTAGKGALKAGLGYTKYDLSKMDEGQVQVKKILDKLSPDIGLIELRVNQKIRVHGFQSQSAFFLLLLDREHRVFKEK